MASKPPSHSENNSRCRSNSSSSTGPRVFFSAEADFGWEPIRRRQPELLTPELLATRSGYLLAFREHGRRPAANSTVRPILYIHGWAGSRNEYFGQTSLTLDRTAPSRLASGNCPVATAGLNFGQWDALQLAQRKALAEGQLSEDKEDPDVVFRRIAEELQEDAVYMITVSRRGYDGSGLAPSPSAGETKDDSVPEEAAAGAQPKQPETVNWDQLSGYQVFATQVVDLLTVLGIRGGVSVFGWSAGGPYAMAVARYIGGHPMLTRRLLHRTHIASQDVDPEDDDVRRTQEEHAECCEFGPSSPVFSGSSSSSSESSLPSQRPGSPDVGACPELGDSDGGCGLELDCQLGLAGRGCPLRPFYIQTLSLVCSDPAWSQAPALLRENWIQAHLFRVVRGDPKGFARRLLRLYHVTARPAVWLLSLVNRLAGATAQFHPLKPGSMPARPPATRRGLLGAVQNWLFWWPVLQLWERRLRAASAQRVLGCLADMRTERNEWGFKPRDIVGVPVTLWHGKEDRLVPAAASAWLGRQLKSGAPELRLRVLPGESHNLMEFRWTQIVGDILRQQFLWRNPNRLELEEGDENF